MNMEDRRSNVEMGDLFRQLRRSVWALSLAGVSFWLISSGWITGCGGGSSSSAPPPNNPAPTLSSGLDP
jgi:hypothetical protein